MSNFFAMLASKQREQLLSNLLGWFKIINKGEAQSPIVQSLAKIAYDFPEYREQIFQRLIATLQLLPQTSASISSSSISASAQESEDITNQLISYAWICSEKAIMYQKLSSQLNKQPLNSKNQLERLSLLLPQYLQSFPKPLVDLVMCYLVNYKPAVLERQEFWQRVSLKGEVVVCEDKSYDQNASISPIDSKFKPISQADSTSTSSQLSLFSLRARKQRSQSMPVVTTSSTRLRRLSVNF